MKTEYEKCMAGEPFDGIVDSRFFCIPLYKGNMLNF